MDVTMGDTHRNPTVESGRNAPACGRMNTRRHRLVARPTVTDGLLSVRSVRVSTMTQYIVEFADPHVLTDGDDRTLTVSEYDDFGSMYSLELPDGNSRSVGKQLVESITEVDSQQ